MKNVVFILFGLLIGCSSSVIEVGRVPAEVVKISKENSFIEAVETDIFPSGLDNFHLKVHIKNTKNEYVPGLKSSMLNLIVEKGRAAPLQQIGKGMYIALVTPERLTKEVIAKVEINDELLLEEKLNTSFSPGNKEIVIESKILTHRTYAGITHAVLEDDNTRVNRVFGYSFDNNGPNDIVTGKCASDADDQEGCRSSREFDIHFEDQVRQNQYLLVTDVPADQLSRMMHSHFYFFPRKVLPYYYFSEDKKELHLVLPTEEEVIFDAKTKKIIGGVLKEGPMDLGPSRFSRKFPDVVYTGKGVALRINGRGQDARLGQFNQTKISGNLGNVGGKGVLIYKNHLGKTEKCVMDKIDFWPNEDLPVIAFRYPDDEKLRTYLQDNCGFTFDK